MTACLSALLLCVTQAWLRQLGTFMKERAPHQLLLQGVLDMFGHNSPHHLRHNPPAQVRASQSVPNAFCLPCIIVTVTLLTPAAGCQQQGPGSKDAGFDWQQHSVPFKGRVYYDRHESVAWPTLPSIENCQCLGLQRLTVSLPLPVLLSAGQVFDPLSHSPHRYESQCHGVDFWLHNQMPEADAAVSTVFPDMHVACNAACKLDWTREWIRAHLRDALRMNKPLVLGGVGALRPQAWRHTILQLVHEEVERALAHGHPIGGECIYCWKQQRLPQGSCSIMNVCCTRAAQTGNLFMRPMCQGGTLETEQPSIACCCLMAQV